MKWKVRLKGHESGLQNLADSFTDDPRIFEDDEQYYLWSQRFEDLDGVDKIRETATELTRHIRNLGQRDSLRVEDLQTAEVVEISDDGSEHTYVRAEGATVTFRANPVTIRTENADGDTEVFLPADRTKEWTELAIGDEAVSELTNFLDNGDSWVNLYRIYEHIQANIESDDNIVAQGWWSEADKDRFKQTANSREAIGDEARHGSERIPAPADPMTKSEAKRQIETLIDHWLNHRKNLQ